MWHAQHIKCRMHAVVQFPIGQLTSAAATLERHLWQPASALVHLPQPNSRTAAAKPCWSMTGWPADCASAAAASSGAARFLPLPLLAAGAWAAGCSAAATGVCRPLRRGAACAASAAAAAATAAARLLLALLPRRLLAGGSSCSGASASLHRCWMAAAASASASAAATAAAAFTAVPSRLALRVRRPAVRAAEIGVASIAGCSAGASSG